MLRPQSSGSIRVLDYVGALLIFCVVEGFWFGSADDLGFAPWLHRLNDPALLASDLRFGDWPHWYYWLYLSYMLLLSKVMPIEWGIVLSSVLSHLLLLVAMQRLAERLTRRFVPTMLLAILMVGYFNNHLIAGYYLTSKSFSSHYPAIALVLLAIDQFIANRAWRASAAILLAGVFNPRLGLFGVGVVALTWFWPQPPARKAVAAIVACILAVGAVAVLASTLPAHVAGMPFDEILRVWVYVRSPGHFAPEAWRGFIFLNIALLGAFLVTIWLVRNDPEARRLCFVALACFALILIGMVNNYLYLIPALVPANPFQLGPIVLAISYVFMAAVLVGRIADGRILSTLPMLIVPDLGTRLLLLLVTIAADRHAASNRVEAEGWPLKSGEATTLAAQAAVFILARLILSGGWQQIDYIASAELLMIRAFWIVAGVLLLHYLRLTAPIVLSAVTGAGLIIAGFQYGSVAGIRIRYGVPQELHDLCRFVRSQTSNDAVFVVPPELAEFQSYCYRAAFFIYDHLPLGLEKFPEWVRRMKIVRLVPPELALDKINRPFPIDMSAYQRLGAADFLRIKRDYPSAEFVLVTGKQALDLPLAFENASYRLYKLAR